MNMKTTMNESQREENHNDTAENASNDIRSGAAPDDGQSCQGYSHDPIVMEPVGVIDMDCPNYEEEDDVKDSIAEGYFG